MTSDLIIYSWDLTKFARTLPSLPQGFEWEESDKLKDNTAGIIEKALLTDSSILSARKFFEGYLAAMKALFQLKEHSARLITLTHGPRIIGASVLQYAPNASLHLFSGPCILLEYRGRGLGSLLFQKSLTALAERGIETARGVCMSRSTLQKYLYPKYEGTAEKNSKIADSLKISDSKSAKNPGKCTFLKKKSSQKKNTLESTV
ncbi:MAG: hypothetical protein ACK5NG_00795 [Chthoniobacterales bacterium]